MAEASFDVEEVVVETKETFTLKMNRQELVAFLAVSYHVGGRRDGPRGLFEDMARELSKVAGFVNYDRDNFAKDVRATGTVMLDGR